MLGSFLLGLACTRPEPSTDPRPNVVLVTIDTLRADRMAIMPTLERLGREGMVFEQAVSVAPITEASHLAMLTSVPPHVSGVVANGTDIGERPALVPSVLQGRGYHTAGFVSAYPLRSGLGWGQGMDRFDDDFGIGGRERRGDRTVERAIAWLEDAPAPFYLWVHLYDPHGPYEAPGRPGDPPTNGAPLPLPEYWPAEDRAITSAAWITAAYDGEVRFADEQLARLVAKLDLDHTILAVVADHGENLDEHETIFDHGDDLYDASLRVPWILRGPGVAAGSRVTCQVSTLDVGTTLLGLADGTWEGPKCGPVLATTPGERFVDHPTLLHALRVPGRKVVVGATPTCFDLAADPNERTPAVEGCVTLEDTLAGMLEGRSPALAAKGDEDLRALGYVE
jgi:arylsulfatase A-like enzyme